MPAPRARQLALAASFLGFRSSEDVIQSFITAGLLSLAEHDKTFQLALMRATGIDWDVIDKVAKESNVLQPG
jgi:hypothetical protein